MSGIQKRLHSIDILRGLIIILMALDHTRDFFGPTAFDPTDLAQTSHGWFVTRWITHFCAPLFIFLSGISAYLYGKKIDSRSELRNFLLSRGLWLVFVEIVIVNFSWQFAYNFMFLQVIWAIGLSMIILAGIIYLPKGWIVAISIATISLHNALDDKGISQLFGSLDWLWAVLHHQKWIPISNNGYGIYVAYPIIPWFAVMSLGYVFGEFYDKPKEIRQKSFIVLGITMSIAFVLLRSLTDYGDPQLWSSNSEYVILSILNTTKYPPSLQFLLMTIGPGLIILALFEKLKSDGFILSKWLLNFGRVPMFFYLLHLPIIHTLSLLYIYFEYGKAVNMSMGSSNWPDTYQANLLYVYLAWVVIIALLYIPSKKFAQYKQSKKSTWLSYL